MFSRSPRYSTWCLTLKNRWDATVDRWVFPAASFRVFECITAHTLTCSPPSLSAALSHWVWYSGCNVACTSWVCSPGHWLVSVGISVWSVIIFVVDSTLGGKKTLTLIFELAVVGLPFLSVLRFSGNKLRMKLLRRQHQCFCFACFFSCIVSENLQSLQQSVRWRKLTIHCSAWAQSGQGTAHPDFSHRSRWYHMRPMRYFHTKHVYFLTYRQNRSNPNWRKSKADVYGAGSEQYYLSGIVMYNKAGVPAVEMFMRPHSCLQFLQQSGICTLSFGVHGGTHIIQHAHDSRRGLQRVDGFLVAFTYCSILRFWGALQLRKTVN